MFGLGGLAVVKDAARGRKPQLYALYNVREGVGYAVEIFDANGEMVQRYTAGDARQDSAVFGVGEIGYDELVEMAISTADDLLSELGAGESYPKPEWSPDVSI